MKFVFQCLRVLTTVPYGDNDYVLILYPINHLNNKDVRRWNGISRRILPHAALLRERRQTGNRIRDCSEHLISNTFTRTIPIVAGKGQQFFLCLVSPDYFHELIAFSILATTSSWVWVRPIVQSFSAQRIALFRSSSV